MRTIAGFGLAMIIGLGLIGCGGGGGGGGATKDLSFPTVINAVPPQQ